jgi:CheY-like chemotaxis protein/signal transduction histidine kinase
VLSTFRAKLLLIVSMALLALLLVLVVSASIGVRQSRELTDVQARLVPKAELGPRIEAEFERLSRGMQDAVAAQDQTLLDATTERKTALFDEITQAGPALDPAAAAALRWSVQDYYESARDVSRRMIAGEAGDALLQDVAHMQARQAKAAALIKKSTQLDRAELGRAFGSIREANNQANRLRFSMTGVGTLLVALLAFVGSRGMLRALGDLSQGFSRFGTGNFGTAIPITTRDELAVVAKEANQMAAGLERLSKERADDDWLKAGLAGLSEQLRGELEPEVVADRALGFLAGRVGALAGAFYIIDADGRLSFTAGYAHSPLSLDSPTARFADSEGLVGQALRSGELTSVSDLPADYLRIKSGLGETVPRELLLLPLVHFEREAGVIELALLKPATAIARELLLAARSTLVIALDAALAGAARSRLLRETQAQAEQLAAQEEELRMNNQELLAQQEELRRANQELEAQRLELAERNGQLELTRTGLQEKAEELNRVSAYKSQFLANMSHELRTPLNSMLLLSHLLSENEHGNLKDKQVEQLRTIHSAGRDLLELINEVLDLSKIEAGKQDVSLESVELSHFVSYVRRLFEATANQKGVALVTELDPAAPAQIVTDRQRVERILTNLVSNALKFTQRGAVTLRIARPGAPNAATSIAFAVSDTGIGIPAAAHERVFAPFEQVQGQTNRGHTGTGLGLPIARESARLLGGDLVLDSSGPGGSTFVCILPERAQDPAARSASSPALPKPVEDDRAELRPDEPYLLIIEDDSVLAEQLVEIAHARRLKAVVVGQGQQGLELARGGKPLGIVLDVKLPDLDGWSVMERLKQDEATRSIPVHFVSGVDAPQRGLALGAVGYLVKPVGHAELARVVRTLVPSAQRSQRILLVEDNADQGTTILALLRREGFQAAHVQTASAALEALASGDFGCMILDLGLPDVDGLGLLETLRQRPELGVPRVVIHTGRVLSKQETRQLEAYAEAVVVKDGKSSERLLEELRLFVHHVTDQTKPAARLELPRSDVSLRGVKLLLAEDDMRTVYSLSALLQSRGAEVVTAETGREALLALSNHPDIVGVLMDVMMPEMDGYEAMRLLRKDARFAKLPVIALTAKAMKGERERCLDAGASDYLPKPIDGERLLATLKSWLSGSAA